MTQSRRYAAAVLICVRCLLPLCASAEGWDVSTLTDKVMQPFAVTLNNDNTVVAAISKSSETGPFTIVVMNLRAAELVPRALVGPAAAGFQDGPATWAKFNSPTGLSYSRDGKWLAVADAQVPSECRACDMTL